MWGCSSSYRLELSIGGRGREASSSSSPDKQTSWSRMHHSYCLGTTTWLTYLLPFPFYCSCYQIFRHHTCSPLRLSSYCSIFHSPQGLYQCFAPPSPPSFSPIYILCDFCFFNMRNRPYLFMMTQKLQS